MSTLLTPVVRNLEHCDPDEKGLCRRCGLDCSGAPPEAKIVCEKSPTELVGYSFWCPACKDRHRYMIKKMPGRDTPTWEFDGNMEAPTFSPSLLYKGGPSGVYCHLFVKAGVIEYCPDCPHALAGQKVPMVPVPEGC